MTFLGTTVRVVCGSVLLTALSSCASAEGQTQSVRAEPSDAITTEQPSEPPETAQEDFADIDAQEVAGLWPVSYRYLPYDSSAELMAEPYIEVAVTGTIESIKGGPIWQAESPDDAEAIPSLVLEVLVQEVLKGQDTTVDDRVYVEMLMLYPLENYVSALPQGTTVALYLEPGRVETENFAIGNDDAGRPPGEPLWSPGPEGIVIADGETEGIVTPLLQEVDRETTFEESLPIGESN